MDLRELKVFVEVVKQGGFSAATKVLFASQSTVSKAIKQLEDEVGVQLFDRVGRKVKLTVAGDLVYRHAIAMLLARENLQNDLADLNGLRRGRIRLGLSRLGSASLFTNLVVQFRKRYPGIEVELVERGVLSLQQALREGSLDLAVCRLPVPDDLDWILVHDEPLLAFFRCLPIREPEFRWRRTLAWKRECPLPPAARTFLDMVKADVAPPHAQT